MKNHKTEGAKSAPLPEWPVTKREPIVATKMCAPAPLGCGGEAVVFTSRIAEKEYHISALCETCQAAMIAK